MIVRRKLDEARGRLSFHHFLQLAPWALLTGLSLMLILRGLALLFPVFPDLPPTVWVAAMLGPLLAAGLVAIFCWRSLVVVARAVDARAPTRDRFLTALKLDRNESAAFGQAVQNEVAAFASSFRLKEHLRLKNPGRNLLWLLLPLAGLGALELFQQWRTLRLAPELAKARQMMVETGLAADRQAEKNPEFEKVVRELELATERFSDSTEPLRDALRALAELEQKLSAATAALSSGEASSLAEALGGEHPQLAADLRLGNNQSAAAEISRLDPGALARALEEAARHGENSRLRELAQQSGSEAQRRLVSILQNSGGSGGESARRKFLSELSDIKSGTSAAGEQAEGGEEGEAGETPNGAEKSAPAQAENAPPGGAPGSEKDLGRGADLAGEGERGEDTRAVEEFVQGKAGEGSSLVEIFRAAGNDDPKAAQAYRSAYGTALPAALDAVNREEIPAGSRLLVRRYFEAIRPKE